MGLRHCPNWVATLQAGALGDPRCPNLDAQRCEARVQGARCLVLVGDNIGAMAQLLWGWVGAGR